MYVTSARAGCCCCCCCEHPKDSPTVLRQQRCCARTADSQWRRTLTTGSGSTESVLLQALCIQTHRTVGRPTGCSGRSSQTSTDQYRPAQQQQQQQQQNTVLCTPRSYCTDRLPRSITRTTPSVITCVHATNYNANALHFALPSLGSQQRTCDGVSAYRPRANEARMLHDRASAMMACMSASHASLTAIRGCARAGAGCPSPPPPPPLSAL